MIGISYSLLSVQGKCCMLCCKWYHDGHWAAVCSGVFRTTKCFTFTCSSWFTETPGDVFLSWEITSILSFTCYLCTSNFYWREVFGWLGFFVWFWGRLVVGFCVCWVFFQNPKFFLESSLCSSAAAATGGSVINVAALLASGTQVTPQIAMAAQMAALQAKALAETGIAVPSYYNPAAVNPMKFAEQEKKRKMLWQGKKEGVMLAFLTFVTSVCISWCL